MYKYKMTGYHEDGYNFKFRFKHKRLISKEKFKHICEMCMIRAAKYVMKKYPEIYVHSSSMDEEYFLMCMKRFGFQIYIEEFDVDFRYHCYDSTNYGEELKEFEAEMDKLELDELDRIYGNK